MRYIKVSDPKKFTRFERARVIGARALQISLGAPVLIKIPKGVYNPLDIAREEFKRGLLPITVLRPLPEKVER